MTLAGRILADFDAEAPLTISVLEAVPEDRFDFQPHPKSWTLAQLAGHVAEGAAVAAGAMQPEVDVTAPRPVRTPFVPRSKAELLEKAEEIHRFVHDLLAGADDTFLDGRWVMRAGPNVLWEARRADAVRTIAIHHTIHHRGQLQLYLHLLGAPRPSIYGPTADAPRRGL